MKKKSFLDSVDVPVPCDKSWDKMIGGDVSRFCKHCEKDIYNISAMTRQEAKKLLFQSKEKVCIRMEREPNGKIKTLKKQLHQITRHVPLAAGVLTASMILSGVNNAQETKVETGKITLTQTTDKNSKPAISGTITTVEEDLIPGVKVILRNTKDNSIKTTFSDKDGIYEFKDITPSDYILETKDKTGFKDFTSQNLSIETGKNINLTITLVVDENAKREVIGVVTATSEIKTETPLIDYKVTPRQIESLPIDNKTDVIGLFGEIKAKKSKNQNDDEFIGKVDVTSDYGLKVSQAVIIGNKGLLQELISKRVNLNEKDKKHWRQTALHVATETGDLEILQILIKAKVNLNIKDDFGITPLMIAASENESETVKILLEAGANPNLKDEDGETAMQKTKSEEIKKLLIKYGAKPIKKAETRP